MQLATDIDGADRACTEPVLCRCATRAAVSQQHRHGHSAEPIADVLHALLSHSGIGTATARAVRAMRCSQMPCSGSGVDLSLIHI